MLPRDESGHVLLVKDADTGLWAAIGGAVEPDESPQECAVREAEEEAGVVVRLGAVLGVLGGPEYRMVYPNGDRTSYVSTVFDAVVVGGTPEPDGEETTEVAWWSPAEPAARADERFHQGAAARRGSRRRNVGLIDRRP